MLGFRQFRDVIAGILRGDELATARQRDWIVKALLPAAIASGPVLSCRIRFWSLSASAGAISSSLV